MGGNHHARQHQRGSKVMVTHVSHIPVETLVILPEDHDLLQGGLKNWYDKVAFTDDHVAQVHRLFAGLLRWTDISPHVGQDPLPQNL